MFFKPLETDRLILKNIAPEDRDFLFREFSNDEINRYLFDAEPFTSPADADELIAFYNEPEPRCQHRWVLVLKSTGEKIGTCGFHCWDRDSGYMEVGYDMQKAHWGHGYMTEALRAILDFAEKDMKARRVCAQIYPGNQRSAALVMKFGFRLTAELVTCVFHGREYVHGVYEREF